MKLEENWVETITIACIVLGFILALTLQNAFLSYFIIGIIGFLAGRTYYIKKHKEPIVHIIILILGFLLGYLIASFWSCRLLSFIIFISTFYLSYYLHREKIITMFKSENFLK